MGVRFSPGSVYAPCADLRSLVSFAYHLTMAVPLTGLPEWAKAPCGPNSFSVEATMPPDTTEEQSRLMMQDMLQDRFKLRAHWEKKEMPVFFLVVAPGGFKGKLFDPKTFKHESRNCPEDDQGCSIFYTTGTMSDLANLLSFSAGRPVIDKTGLTERYAASVMWASDKAETSSLPSLPTALRETLGLQLKPETARLDVLTVDHVEKPSAN